MLGKRGLQQVAPDGALPQPGLRDDLRCHLPGAYKQAIGWLGSQTGSKKVTDWLMPKPGHLGLFRWPVYWLDQACRLTGRLPRSGSPLGLGPGDLLILPDGYWGKMEIWEYVEAARRAGAFTVVILYDLIPLTHPHFAPRRTPARFKLYLREAVRHADLLMAISRTVHDQLRDELPQLFSDLASPQLDHFPLGADFVAPAGPVREELQQLFGPQHPATPYISVSAFVPRKNQAFTLAAFEQLWQHGNDAGLVYIGGRGWMCEDLLRRLANHPRLGDKLFVFHDLTDRELSFCYQHARGTIMASVIEGFGLPIIESLWHRRRTFVSDTPIHREVGGADVDYFSLSSPASLVDRIENWEAAIRSGTPVQRPAVNPVDWCESTRTLLTRCLAAYASKQSLVGDCIRQQTHAVADSSLTKVA